MSELGEMFKDIGANMQLLGISGVFGAAVKAIVAPERKWRRRIAQGLAGAASAVFIGPLVANLLTGFVSVEVYAWLAAGFICGYGGEIAIILIQNKFLGGKK